jgi:hypothetical protein
VLSHAARNTPVPVPFVCAGQPPITRCDANLEVRMLDAPALTRIPLLSPFDVLQAVSVDSRCRVSQSFRTKGVDPMDDMGEMTREEIRRARLEVKASK